MLRTIYDLSFIVLLIAVLSDLFIPIIIGTKYPGYNHCVQTISTLGTEKSPVQKYQCINLIIVGVLFIIFSLGQYFIFDQKSWAHNWYTAGIVIFAIGCIFAGLFPEDIKGIAETSSGKIHGITSGIGFLFLILNPLWAVWIKEFSGFRTFNIIFFILGIVTFTFFLISENKNNGFLRFTGLFQRLNLVFLYGALVLNYLGLRGSS